MKKKRLFHERKNIPFWLIKIFRIMKISVFLFFTGIICIYADNSYSQETKLSIDKSEISVSEALLDIESQSEFYFLYSNKLVDVNRKVSISVKEEPVEIILNHLFANTDIRYVVYDRQIILSPEKMLNKTLDQMNVSPQDPTNIKGIITDSRGSSLPGVNIMVKGTTIGSITDIDGNYTIQVDNPDVVLVFSFIGFEDQEITVGNQTIINVTLNESIYDINEVVTIGYGTVKKSDLTGAVSSIKSEDLPLAANTSVEQMLSGQASGVLVAKNDAQPGGGISILIRGAASTGAGNAPLYIIDGFPVTGGVDPGTGTRYSIGSRSPLNSINPNDIESIEILKDASATAIYGARAANGVIIVTTKSGKKGKVNVDYNFKQSWQTLAQPYESLSGAQYMEQVNHHMKETWLSDNNVYPYGTNDPISNPYPGTPKYSPQEIAEIGDGTNWFDLVTRTGKITENNLAISGGTETTKYLFSVNSFDQEGVVEENNFNRLTARINIDQEIRHWLKVGINATGSRILIDNPALGSAGRDSPENTGVIGASLHFDPTLPVRDENGNYSIVANSAFFPNPVSLLEITNNTSQSRLLTQGYAEIEPIKNLIIKTQIGADLQGGTTRSYLPKTTLYGEKVSGQADINQNNRADYLFNAFISYTRGLFDSHNISALVGYEFQEFNMDGYSASNRKFSTDAFLYNSLQSGESEKPGVYSYKAVDKLASYFGRVNYNISDKYLFTITMRADGSTRFGEGNKWGFFPSGAFAWRVINEDFMKNQNVMSNLKLRLSLGQTGNSNISGAFAYYSFGNNYIFGDYQSKGTYLSSYNNDNLKWETTTEYNFGLDLGFFNNRISATLELFYKEVSDLLGYKQLRTYLENSNAAANLGITSSKGFELFLKTENLVGKFKWNTTFNVSAYNDRWKERSDDVILASYQNETDPIRVHWGYETDGYVQPGEEVPHMPGALPGWLKIKDIDGFDENNEKTGMPDGQINDADKVMLSEADPDFIFGFTNNFEYKNFDLSILVYGMTGIMKINHYIENSQYGYEMLRGWNKSVGELDVWSSDNPDGKYPNNIVRNPFPGGHQFLLQKADFVRVQNITLGYSLSNSFLENKFFKTVRIYFDVANPFIISSFEGVDPEYGGEYPTQRTFTLGLNLIF